MTLPVVLVDPTMCRILRKLNNDLRSTYTDIGKRIIPSLEEPWRAGDVREIDDSDWKRWSRQYSRSMATTGGSTVSKGIMLTIIL